MDMLAALECVVGEHERIRGHLKLVGDSLSDREAVQTVEKSRINLLENISQPLSVRLEAVLKALATLAEGLKNHYAFEEAELPPILGEVLTRAMEIEHKELLEEIESAKSVLLRTKLEGLTEDEKIVEQALIIGLLDRIERKKQDHMQAEETVLKMARVALEAGRNRKASTTPLA